MEQSWNATCLEDIGEQDPLAAQFSGLKLASIFLSCLQINVKPVANPEKEAPIMTFE